MELWEQLLLGVFGIIIIFWFAPGIKAVMESSKNAEQKHWGTVLMLTAALILFVLFLIWSVR